jgi:hypothetical protein
MEPADKRRRKSAAKDELEFVDESPAIDKKRKETSSDEPAKRRRKNTPTNKQPANDSNARIANQINQLRDNSKQYASVMQQTYPTSASTYQARLQHADEIFQNMNNESAGYLAGRRHDCVQLADTHSYGVEKPELRIPKTERDPDKLLEMHEQVLRNEEAIMGNNTIVNPVTSIVNPFAIEGHVYGPTIDMPGLNYESSVDLEFFMNEMNNVWCNQFKTADSTRSVPTIERRTLIEHLVAEDPNDLRTKCIRKDKCIFSAICRMHKHPQNIAGKLTGKGFFIYPHDPKDMAVEMQTEFLKPESSMCVICMIRATNDVVTLIEANRLCPTIMINPFQVKVGPGEFKEESLIYTSASRTIVEGNFPLFDVDMFWPKKYKTTEEAKKAPCTLTWLVPVF